MIRISAAARKSLTQYLDELGPSIGLRLVITGDTPGSYQPEFFNMGEDDLSPEDICVECGGLKVYIDPQTAQKAQGLKVDLLDTMYGPRLKFEFPSPRWNDPITNQLQGLIDRRINPGLMNHGGYVSLLSVKDGVAEIRMGGGCQGCGLSSLTLNQVVEAVIKDEIPEIHTVVDATNHARGVNPYYPPTYREDMSRSARRRSSRKGK